MAATAVDLVTTRPPAAKAASRSPGAGHSAALGKAGGLSSSSSSAAAAAAAGDMALARRGREVFDDMVRSKRRRSVFNMETQAGLTRADLAAALKRLALTPGQAQSPAAQFSLELVKDGSDKDLDALFDNCMHDHGVGIHQTAVTWPEFRDWYVQYETAKINLGGGGGAGS
eukprot:g6609.t1